jgi:quercetin dioxygenase-like cupin family protein
MSSIMPDRSPRARRFLAHACVAARPGILGTMDRWHIPSVEASGRREPRVLFSTPECRAVVIDLNDGDELGDHSVHERASLLVVSGQVMVAADGGDMACPEGTLVVFDPGERHSVRAAGGPARLLLTLAPWPGDGHYPEGAHADASSRPSRASADPMS